MPEDGGRKERRSIVNSKIEAFSFSSDLLPHDSIIAGYEKAIPGGGKDVITIVKRQQTFAFIVSLAALFSNNLVPLALILPVLLAISAGSVVEITIVSAVPIGLFTAGGAVNRIVASWRGGAVQRQAQVSGTVSAPGQSQLPPQAGDADS